jgi:hypothetical protein
LRKYVIVEEERHEGKPITKEELARILARPHNPEITTFGKGTPVTPLKKKTEV